MSRASMLRFHVVAPLVAMVGLLASCSSGTETATNPPSTTVATPSTVKVGTPMPPLPAEINAIPYKPGDLVALGNAQVTLGVPVTDGRRFSFDVTITSGSLNTFSTTSDMFRVYTVDGTSYLPEADGDHGRFGDITLEPGQTVTGTVVVNLNGDSEPAMFVVDLSASGERVMPGAWVFDPDFSPDTQSG